MGGKKQAGGAIRFVADFDHVEVGRTVAYKVGDVVEAPDQALLAAAGDRAVLDSPEQPKGEEDGD